MRFVTTSKNQTARALVIVLAALLGMSSVVEAGAQAPAEIPAPAADAPPKTAEKAENYVLGAEDRISIWVLEADEFGDKVFQIDASGTATLPLIGRMQLGGLDVRSAEAAIRDKLQTYIRKPEVRITVTEFRSQPVSIMGAVNTPGVHQVQGQKTLIEALSLAGGLRQDAGHVVTVVRRAEFGTLPVSNARRDLTGQFYTAEVKLKDLMEGKNPHENIMMKPRDVVTVPRAEMVYVIGEVKNSGGYVMNERTTISVLQALALAGGLNKTAAPHKAKISTLVAGDANRRIERNIQLNNIMDGKEPDVMLNPDDILFIPTNTARNAALRLAEAAIQTGTGIVIWRSARY
jgi:polysaccharide export outer membrane protein